MPFKSYPLLWFFFFTIPFSYAQHSESWESKVDPILLAKAKDGAIVDFLIVLREQKSMDKMPALKTKADGLVAASSSNSSDCAMSCCMISEL